jgi:hypothetical protein
VPESTRANLLDGRLTVAVGKTERATIIRVGLLANGRACTFTSVRPGEIVGVRVTRRGAVGVKVVSVTTKGATLKPGTTRPPRGTELCLRGGA